MSKQKLIVKQAMNINTLFDTLDDWRYLPAYQLERRADIFFALHLKEILLKLYETEIDLIIPEFPVRKGSLLDDADYNNKSAKNYKPNQSFKIDYLAYSKKEHRIYFIELKTDVGSRNPKQDWYLKEAQKLGIHKILDDLKTIHKASNKNGRIKYEHLFKKLNDAELIKGADTSFEIINAEIKTEIIYIQPTSDIIDNSIITFQKIIELFKNDSNTELTKRFLESLKNWQTDCEK